MKKILLNIITIVFIMSILLIQLPVKAATEDNKIIIQKSNKEFIIYYKDICNNQFNFAFSTDKDTAKEDLIFISSVEDKIQDERLNTAYTNEKIYDKYFKDNDKQAYIWIKNTNGDYMLNAEKIDLSKNIMTDSQIEYVDNTTKRIKGEERNSSITNVWTDDDNVKHTVILSQYVISKEADTEYYYQMVKIPNGETKGDNAKFYDIASKLQEGISSKYEKFETQKEFYDLYNKLYPEDNDSKWEKTEDGYIVEPKDTITGDRYIIWIKAVKDGETTKDVKFLLCYQKDDEKKEKYTPVEVVKTPKTYDSKVLLVAFGVIVALIVVVLYLKRKSDSSK